MNSKTIKLKMPFTTWCQVQRKAKEINSTREEKIDIDEYAEVSRWGLLVYHLSQIEIGYRENLEPVEFYNKTNIKFY